jgi:integrase
MGVDPNGRFAPIGLSRKGWATSAPVRDIFRRAFKAAGLPYRNPHSVWSMLVRYYMEMDLSPARLKAISQSLGHSDVLTTFTSYGQLPTHRQSELIRAIGEHLVEKEHDPLTELEAVIGRPKAERQNGYAST